MSIPAQADITGIHNNHTPARQPWLPNTKKISGPLLDRIDIHIEVPRVDYEKLSGNRLGGGDIRVYSSARASCKKHSNTTVFEFRLFEYRIIRYRLQCRHALRGDSAVLSAAGRGSELDASPMSQLNLSARAYHRIHKLSRTIADLAGREEI